MKTKDQLIQEIVDAFSGVKFPGNEDLVIPSYGEESDLIRKYFTGQDNWQKLTPEFIDQDSALAFFSCEAFRFYLPAFMRADINEKLKLNDPSVRLCWSLTPQSENQKLTKVWGGGTVGEQAKECFNHFSDNQVKAIVSYLQWKLHQTDDYSIQQALEHYWLKRTS